MAAKVKIHRGNQIGGCITEIWTEKTRILIDFGEELPGSKKPEQFEMDWGAIDDGTMKKPAVSAVFFTHYHGDHIGRFMEAYEHAHIYMSKLSRDVLINIHGYLAENLPWLAKRKEREGNREEAARILEEAGKHEDALKILAAQGEKRVHTFCPHEKKPITDFGDIHVTPFWVDHSAGDACMFLIDTEDKRILHTGDFRGHGLHGEDGSLMCDEIRKLADQKQISALITEGTMLSRQNEKPYSEKELLETAAQFFRDQRNRHAFLIVSSTNLDSISAFYQAAKANGIHMYCHNPYVEKQIETLGMYAHEHWGLPKMNDVERVRLWDSGQQKEMREDGFVTIIKANEVCEELVKQFQDCNPVIIYSMWQGYYLQGLDPVLCRFVDACKGNGIPVYPLTDSFYGPLHTSGHASPELIAEVINAADPEELIPIHTEDAREFLGLDISKQLKENLQERMIRAGEWSGYSPEEDHRSLTDGALKKFLPKRPDRPEGSHHAFVRLVKEHPRELAFCFRGNSGNAAIIYYKNHVMFHITSTGIVKFNFDHARYMTDWQERKMLIEKKPYQYIGFGDVPENGGFPSTGYISMSAERAAALTLTDLERLYGCFEPMISRFSQKQKLVEKSVQQKLFLTNKKLKDGYYFYDMEFVQPYGKVLGCKNQPDMLAIRFNEAGEPTHLALVEVKSKRTSVRGKSGLAPHIIGMEQYPERLMEARRKDAYLILEQYMALGLIDLPELPLVKTQFEKLSKEVLLIFTGQDTIAELDTPLNEGDTKTIRKFLTSRNYCPVKGELPGITLDDKAVPMEVYRKDFSINPAG